MAVTTQRFSLAEYFDYNDGTDSLYELVNGELLLMALGTGKHGQIVDFIKTLFADEIVKIEKDWVSKQMAIGVQSPRGDRWDTVRIPDVVIISKKQWRDLQNREALIRLNEETPLLVVEVVSESTKGIDYRAKRAEYAVLNIPEYWIVDPLLEKVTVFTLSEGWYDEAIFTGNTPIISPTFTELNLTADQIFKREI